MQLAKAAKGKERKAAQAELDKAQVRVQRYAERISSGPPAALPKVEVGCLEEVIAKMEMDSSGDWGNVMFVPAGSIGVPSVVPK